MKPIRYLLCQMELEGIRIVGDHLICRVSPDVADFPLMLVAQTCDGHRLVCVDDRLPPYLRALLLGSKPDFARVEAAMRILETSGIIGRATEFNTYVFPGRLDPETTGQVSCLRADDPRVKAFGMGDLAGHVFAIEKDGRVVSACVSSRQNHRCAEAWVVTHPSHRQKGYGRQVVLAWAAAQQAAGLIPFYSHDVRNEESCLLAESLGLQEVFTETVIERVA